MHRAAGVGNRGIRPEFHSRRPTSEPPLPEIRPRLSVPPNATLPCRQTQHRVSIRGFRASVEQDGPPAGWRRPAFGQQRGFAGFVFAIQVIENLSDHHGVLDAGDDLHCTAAGLAGLDAEHPFQSLRLTLIDARRSAGVGGSSDTLVWLALPRFAGVTRARCLLLGAKTP